MDRQITADDVSSGEWHCRLASCSEYGSIVEITLVVIPLGDVSTVSELLGMSELLELV